MGLDTQEWNFLYDLQKKNPNEQSLAMDIK